MKRGVHGIIFNDAVNYGNIWQRTVGAYAIATQLRSLGFRIQVIDFWSFITFDNNELVKQMLDKFIGTDTLFVGFSTTFMSSTFASSYKKPYDPNPGGIYNLEKRGETVYGLGRVALLDIRSHIWSKNPRIDIVVGGARVGASRDPIGTVRVMGYGEMSMLDYISWKTGNKPLFSPPFVDGARTLAYNVKAEGFDFQHSTALWQPEDCIQPNETLPIEVSRGCIFNCKFCSFPLNGRGKNDYLKDVEVLRGEFMRNYELYGTTRYVFADDTYNDSTAKLQWMNEVKKGLPFDLKFATYARLDLIISRPEQAELLLENGLSSVFFGIESLNTAAAKSIGKGMASEKIVEGLHWLRSVWGNDVITAAGFITGLPHDTYPIMEKWMASLIDHRFPLHSYVLSPLSIVNKTRTKRPWYSEFDKDPGKFGYILPEVGDNWSNPTYGTTQHGCNDLAQDFFLYVNSMGRMTVPAHVTISLQDYGWDHTRQILESRIVSMEYSALQSLVYQRFINYVHDVMALPEYD